MRAVAIRSRRACGRVEEVADLGGPGEGIAGMVRMEQTESDHHPRIVLGCDERVTGAELEESSDEFRAHLRLEIRCVPVLDVVVEDVEEGRAVLPRGWRNVHGSPPLGISTAEV